MRSERVVSVKADLAGFAAERKNLKAGDDLGLALNVAKTEALTAFKATVDQDLENANYHLAQW